MCLNYAMLHTIVCDGGCIGNGRKDAVIYFSFAVIDNGKTVHAVSKQILTIEQAWTAMFSRVTDSCDREQHAKGTNNIAEFVAMIEAMKVAHQHKLTNVRFETDADQVVTHVVKVPQSRGPDAYNEFRSTGKHLEAYALRIREALRLHPEWTVAKVGDGYVKETLGH